MSDSPSPPLLEVRCVRKRFPGVQALQDVDLTLGHGEVLAVVGENGAGKSTLMKILAGVQVPDSGEILIDGKQVAIDSVKTAIKHGIVIIHQELNLSDNLTVAANIYLGREPLKFGLIDQSRIDKGAREVLAQVGLDVAPSDSLSTMPIGQQQLIEIAKALSVEARILIMDEPTSSLSTVESEKLFKVVNELRSKGVGIIYISHRLGEVKKLADRVLVLRDGQNVGELSRKEITHDNMVKLMVGREISQFYSRRPHQAGKPMLQVENLVTPAWPRHRLNFTVHAGEIVGVAGLVGAGRTEMLQVLFGIDQALSGTIRVDGRIVKSTSTLKAIQSGLALVPEDRKRHGLIVDMPLNQNMSLAGLRRNRRRFGMLNFQSEKSTTNDMISRLKIKTPGPDQITQFLSGGNQQKVVLGKWLSMNPSVLLLDEPTRGIDVGAKQEIYSLMEDLAERGVAILFVSSEMEEILGMSDRTLVMHEGRITGELKRDQLTEEAVMQLATGNVEVKVEAK